MPNYVRNTSTNTTGVDRICRNLSNFQVQNIVKFLKILVLLLKEHFSYVRIQYCYKNSQILIKVLKDINVSV